MPVPSSAADLSTAIASNSPAGTDAIGTSMDDYLRAISGILRQMVSAGTDITAASTITVPNDGHVFTVNGNTTITAIANSWIGRAVLLRFAGTPQLTHNGTSFVLPGSANITAAAGDWALFIQTATSVWRCALFSRATGVAVAAPYLPLAGGTVSGATTFSALLTAANGVSVSNGATVTGTVQLPATTTIGNVSQQDLERLDVTIEGMQEPSKVVTANGSGFINIQSGITLNLEGGLQVDGTTAELNRLLTPITLIPRVGGTNSFDYTSVPSWVRRITIAVDQISTAGTASIYLRIGDSGGLETTGYKAGYGTISVADNPAGIADTTGFPLITVNAAGNTFSGVLTLTRISVSGDLWAMHGILFTDSTTDGTRFCAGSKQLSAALDRFSLVSADGFDAGTINVLYE